MDRSTTVGGDSPLGSNTTPLSNPAGNARVEGAAQTAHRTVDRSGPAQLDSFSLKISEALPVKPPH